MAKNKKVCAEIFLINIYLSTASQLFKYIASAKLSIPN